MKNNKNYINKMSKIKQRRKIKKELSKYFTLSKKVHNWSTVRLSQYLGYLKNIGD